MSLLLITRAVFITDVCCWCVLLYDVEAVERLQCVDRELRGPLARRCSELYEFNVAQRTKHEC